MPLSATGAAARIERDQLMSGAAARGRDDCLAIRRSRDRRRADSMAVTWAASRAVSRRAGSLKLRAGHGPGRAKRGHKIERTPVLIAHQKAIRRSECVMDPLRAPRFGIESKKIMICQ